MSASDRDRIRADWPLYRLGLLPEERQLEMERLLAEHPEFMAQIPTDDRDPSHILASILSAWPGSLEQMGEFERSMVRQHLERCGECREDLRTLHGPDAIRHLDGLDLASESPASRPRPRSPKPGRGNWLTAASLLTAAAAVTLLLVRSPEDIVVPPQLSIEATSRAAMAVTEISLSDFPVRLRFEGPTQLMGDGVRVVQVLDAGGSSVFRQEFGAAAFDRVNGEIPLTLAVAGSYRVQLLVGPDADVAVQAEIRLDVRP